MKQNRIIGIVLAVINAVLIIFCTVMYLRTDRTVPGIEFQSTDTIYREGMDNTSLLAGISAYDSRDGEITDRIVIEKLIENKEENCVIVFYAASDKAGNVAKASRVFPAVYRKDDSTGGQDMADTLLEAGITAELNESKEGLPVSSGGEEAVPELEETPVPEETPVLVSSPEPARTPQAEQKKTPEPEPVPTPDADPAAPVLILKQTEVNVTAGQGPAWVDVIDVLKDDKDNYETLFKNLSVSKYDRNKPGSYPVTVWTEDSEGNRSQAVPLTIVVK